ncbi:hypothetical protein FRC06_001661 [Ceratobasidium sp. 370]|nr:hypothetical protein FRC06_001661 [Ceratobasidium sp. 370]
MVDSLLKVIDQLGVYCISSIVSDDTNVTKKARRLAAAHICLDRLWALLLIRLHRLLKHFKLSNQATGELNAARKSLVLENLPALYKIYSEGDMDTAANPLPEIVAEVMDDSQPAAIEFKLKITDLINILEPPARAILCLESTGSDISDVYFFWLSALASLNRLFCSKTTTLTTDDKSRIQAIIYYRFSEAINEAPTDTYITVFFLDPRYRTASIYLDSSDFHAPQATVLCGDTGRSSARRGAMRPSSRLTGSVYSRIRQQLMWMLRDDLMVGQKRPDHPLYQYDSLRAKTELTAHLQQYHSGLPPFRQFSPEHESVLEYWTSHKNSHFIFILSLRTQLDAHSMIKQVQFSQFMAMVDGPAAPTQKTSIPHSRFYKVKQECIDEYIGVNASEDCPVALADEPGEEWLESQEDGFVVPGPAQIEYRDASDVSWDD